MALVRRTSLALPFLLLAAATVACNADLETTCISGDCTPYVPAEAEVDQPMGCFATCDTEVVDAPDGEFPCEVEEIMATVCRNCHTAPAVPAAAPFPLDTLQEAHELRNGFAIYFVAHGAVSTDFMPLGGPPLSDEQKSVILDDWACNCAPAREEGETCE